MTNFAGADHHGIAKALYAVIADAFDDGKVTLCVNGKTLSVGRSAAAAHVARGATLGNCSNLRVAGMAATESTLTPHTLQLSSFPNPSSSEVNFTFASPGAGRTSLQIINIRGEVIATVFSGEMNAGEEKTLSWQPALTVAPGMYIGRLSNAYGVSNQKVLLTR
jgi:hypothetical protein